MRFSSIALAATALLTAACQTTQGGQQPHLATSVNPQFSPVLSQERLIHTVTFAPGSALSAQEDAALAAFLNAIGPRFGDRVSIEDSQPIGQVSRHAVVAKALARVGLMLQEPTTQPPSAPTAANQVRVVIVRGIASAPNCPDWRHGQSPNFGNVTMSNYGCATVSNLAAMVADPNDLQRGQDLAPGNAASVSKPINAWNQSSLTGFGATSSALGSWTGTGPALPPDRAVAPD
jgi:pilus assembly protein CpaD